MRPFPTKNNGKSCWWWTFFCFIPRILYIQRTLKWDISSNAFFSLLSIVIYIIIIFIILFVIYDKFFDYYDDFWCSWFYLWQINYEWELLLLRQWHIDKTSSICHYFCSLKFETCTFLSIFSEEKQGVSIFSSRSYQLSFHVMTFRSKRLQKRRKMFLFCLFIRWMHTNTHKTAPLELFSCSAWMKNWSFGYT